MPIISSAASASARGYGFTANIFGLVISTNQTNLDLRAYALTAGWDGVSNLTVTIGSGVQISSNSTGTPALTVSGSFPSGVKLVNNGFIYGMGGAGGAGRPAASSGPGGAGSAGGLALSVSSAITITNNGTIGGGGGGGGGGGQGSGVTTGGGGGGGISSFAANSSGGSGYVAGGSGTYTAAGGGGAGQTTTVCFCGGPITYTAGSGGNGGSRGATGSTGGTGDGQPGGAGGAGGGAVTGNSNITWLATGTRSGSIT